MSVEKIEYRGEQLALGTIAKKEGLIDITLARHYKRTGNIYTAVRFCKKVSRGKIEKIEYYGEMLPISVIAKKEELDITTLTKYYKQTGNIYEAIKTYRKNMQARKERAKLVKEENENKKIEYKNQKLQLKEIAKIEGLDARELRKYFDILGDIYKAVFMAKYQMGERQTVKVQGVTLNLYDLSLLIGVKYSVLNNLLNQGMTTSQIKEIYPCENAGENIKLPNEQTLLEYCVEHNLNLAFLYRIVHTYGKIPEQALAAFRIVGQNIPSSWVFDKYMPEFNKLGITGISTTAMVHNLVNKQISLEELLEENILRKNSEKNGIPEEWGKILYSILETRKIIGEDFQKEICLNEDEEKFIEACKAELKPQGSTNPKETVQKEQEDITHD